MRVFVILVCLMMLTVWPTGGATSVANVREVSTEEQGFLPQSSAAPTVCINSDRLSFEQFYIKAKRPEVPPGTCAHGMSVYRALNAAQSACLQGYARHGNGRCYRIVNKPQDGRAVRKHAYGIVFREGCQLGALEKERKVEDLGVLEALDMCDEDGGCVDAWTPESKTVVPGRACVEGQVADAGGTCRKLLTMTPQVRRTPKQRGQPAVGSPGL